MQEQKKNIKKIEELPLGYYLKIGNLNTDRSQLIEKTIFAICINRNSKNDDKSNLNFSDEFSNTPVHDIEPKRRNK